MTSFKEKLDKFSDRQTLILFTIMIILIRIAIFINNLVVFEPTAVAVISLIIVIVKLCVASLVLVSAFTRKLSLIRISFWTTVFDIVLTLVLFLYAIILIFVIISQKGTVGGWYVLIIYVIILCIECLWLWTIRQARRELEEEDRKKRASIFSTKAMPTPWSMK